MPSSYGWPRAMSIDTAAEYVGLSGSSVQGLRRAKDFPQPVQLTKGRIVWLREDLDAWLDAKAGKTPEVELDGWDAHR